MTVTAYTLTSTGVQKMDRSLTQESPIYMAILPSWKSADTFTIPLMTGKTGVLYKVCMTENLVAVSATLSGATVTIDSTVGKAITDGWMTGANQTLLVEWTYRPV